MSDAAGRGPRRRKPTLAERRERRAAVEDVAEVLDAAARYLEVRPRSEAEVRRRLVSMGFRADLVETSVARLVELGYLDDASFTRTWVESRDRASPRGEHALRLELARKGIDRALVDEVLAERRGGEGPDPLDAVRGPNVGGSGTGDEPTASADERAAQRLLGKRLRSIEREPDPRRRRQKAYALLARNGFAPDVCSLVSRSVVAALGVPEGDEDDPGPA